MTPTIDYFKEHNVKPLIADFTRQPSWMFDEIKAFGRAGVPLVLYYPSNGGDPVVMPNTLLGSEDVLSRIRKAEGIQ